MREQLKNLRQSRQILLIHLVVYGAVAGYMMIDAYLSDEIIGPKLGITLAVLVLMALLEATSFRSGKNFLEGNRLGILYHAGRLAFATVFFFAEQTQRDEILFLTLTIAFAIETIFYIPFDEVFKRIGCYALFATFYIIFSISLTMSLMYKDNELYMPAFMLQLMFDIASVLALIAIGEILANIWNYLEERLMSQNRAMEDLNEVNEALQEHQERIKKTNEMLGMQKIELQAANKKINRAHDEMSVQNEISAAIAATLEKEELLNHVTRIMQIRLDMDWVMVILEPDNSLLVPGEEPQGRFLAMSTSMGDKFEQEIRDSVCNTELTELLLLSKTYIQNSATDTVKFFKYLDEEREPASLICLPISKNEERLGTLIVGKNRDNVFMDSRNFYENIASQLSIGISNVALYEKMNDMAIRDGLTRIYNRRHLTELLNSYLSEAMNQKVPVSLALFDIDKFKMVNDTYGHQCGDEVIRYVATLLNRCALSHGGIAGRYGGEEFVIAFLGKNIDETYEIVKEVHDQIRSGSVIFGDREVQVRASAGVASYPKTCSNPSELLTRADWAMYHSKRNGRDQITIDSDQIKNTM